MKRRILVPFGLLALAGLAVAQNFGTNEVTTDQAIRIASRLRVGMDEWEAMRFLGTNGLSVGYTVGDRLHGIRFYKLSDGSELQLEIDIGSKTFTNRVLESASILQHGKLTPITMANSFQLASIANAVKVASNLRVGMPGADAQKYLQDQGITQTNICSLSLDRGRTMKCPYPLAGDATLMLEMHCTKAPPGLFGWSNPVLDRAYIQDGSNIVSIRLGNGP